MWPGLLCLHVSCPHVLYLSPVPTSPLFHLTLNLLVTLSEMFTLHVFHIQLLSDDVEYLGHLGDAVFSTVLHPSRLSSSSSRELTLPSPVNVIYLIQEGGDRQVSKMS